MKAKIKIFAINFVYGGTHVKNEPDPKVVANDMRKTMNNGVLRFGPSEWLSYRQTASYFSREAAKV
jgi:hypothetical protein